MPDLNLLSIDLAISSKRELAYVLMNLPISKYIISIGSSPGILTGKDVNPTLGNNFQMEWDDVGNKVLIHNDYPIYSGGDYYSIDETNELKSISISVPSSLNGKTLKITVGIELEQEVTFVTPASVDKVVSQINTNITRITATKVETDKVLLTPVSGFCFNIGNGDANSIFGFTDGQIVPSDKTIALTSLLKPPNQYNHIFLVNGAFHIGSLEIKSTSTPSEPIPVGTKVNYMGWVYRDDNDEIVVRNIGRLIDLAFLMNTITYLEYLDDNKDMKVTLKNNKLRFTGFFGPNVIKTIKEVGLSIIDDTGLPVMVAYSKVSDHTLLSSENLRISWKIIV